MTNIWTIFPTAAILLAFSLPKGYEAKQADVDKVFAIISTRVKELNTKIEDVVFKKIPKASQKKTDWTTCRLS